MRKILTSSLFSIFVIFVSFNVHSALIDRGEGLIYDTDLDITWLQDANYAATSDYVYSGMMTWDRANDWIASLNNSNFLGFSNWRSPSALNTDGSEPCSGYNCFDSELGHLYYVELGNTAGGTLLNTGPFINVHDYRYWSGTEYVTQPNRAWYLSFGAGNFGYAGGYQTTHYKLNQHYVWPVRDGDVSPTPEPFTTTMLLLAGGYVGLLGWRRRSRK